MKLKDILDIIDIDKMWEFMIQEYPDQDKQSYMEALEELKQTELIEPEDGLRIEILVWEKESDDDVDGWHVHGIDDNQSWGIEFVDWGKWLAMEVVDSTEKNLTNEQMAALCLWEMTFMGFDNDSIQNQMKELEESVAQIEEDIKNGTAKSFKSVDEFFAELEKEE